MKSVQISVRGTLNPDGTLKLDEAPALPPGPVEVLIRLLPAAQDVAENWWQYLQRERAQMLAQGYQFRTEEQIDAERTRERDLDRAREEALDHLRDHRG